MSSIELELAHSYKANPRVEDDFALSPLKITFDNGGAYALLGPSGCGKTTMLNLISGLISPSQGVVKFDGRDVTRLTPQQRNIAQVFQFPVIYDTMTVRGNLEFPLKNRGVAKNLINHRVASVAEMLELTDELDKKASNLGADQKQIISLGRGLVRDDVSAILFDEPLTVIDPHLKWRLRRKLKQIHNELRLTLIYVTHDQVEALTFADEIAVMSQGKVVQMGTSDDLYERPNHTFVGHFIGSPGMNYIPAEHENGVLNIMGQKIMMGDNQILPDGSLKLGVRPEYLEFNTCEERNTVVAEVVNIKDLGSSLMISCKVGECILKSRVSSDKLIPRIQEVVWLKIIGKHTCFYHNDKLVS